MIDTVNPEKDDNEAPPIQQDNGNLQVNNKFAPVAEGQPDFLQGIREKPYFTNQPVDLDVNFTPYNHFTMEVPKSSDGIYNEPDYDKPVQPEPSFIESAWSKFKEENDALHYLHAGYTQLNKPWFNAPDPNFNIFDHQDEIVNVQPEYQAYLLDSQNKADMDFRLQRIYQEQSDKENIANGSWLSNIAGGTAGIFTDATNLIPIVSWVKYGKYGKTFLNGVLRSLPGAAAYGATSSLGEQLDSINGNAKDWLIDTLTRTSFTSALFGLGGVADLSIDKLNLMKLRQFANDDIDGIGYKLKVDKDDKVVGLEAFNKTNEAMNAKKIELAQDRANAVMSQTGLFRIPYLGTAAEKFLGNKFLGSPMVRLLNSPYKIVSYIADRAVDHGIITEGMANKIASPYKFFTLMNQTHAETTALESQINALHLEANGFKTSNYIKQSAINAGLFTRQKLMDIMGKDIGDKPYLNREDFFARVEQVLHSEVPDQLAPINEAASMFRKKMDTHYKAFRETHNLPDDWLPPRTAEGYLMRVYDTEFMNGKENEWVKTVSDYLRDSDNLILEHTAPIKETEQAIKEAQDKKEALLGVPNVMDKEHAELANEIIALKAKRNALKDKLQNAIRNDPKFHLLAEDWNALSADEAKELEQITKRRDVAQKEYDAQKKVVDNIKKQAKSREDAAMEAKTRSTAESNKRKADTGELVLKKEQDHLDKLEAELEDEKYKLQKRVNDGEINPRYYFKNKEGNYYIFKDPNDRLKLRKTYHETEDGMVSEKQAHSLREEHARAYYHTIMNQTADDTVNQVMSKFTGNTSENLTKARTLLIPDQVLYDGKFMSKNLMAKYTNYVTWLDRRTHLKNVYSESSLYEGFEPLVRELDKEFKVNRQKLNDYKTKIEEKLSQPNISAADKKSLQKDLAQAEQGLNKETANFNEAKYSVNFMYQKMMGLSNLTKGQKAFEATVKSLTVAANLGFLPYTMITDLSAIGLKHGVLPMMRDGILPVIRSLGGMLKSKNSEAFRHGAGALNLALQHVITGTAERNMGIQANPYLNLGKIPAIAQHLAHGASNFSLANFIDNMLQRITSSVAQSEIMRISHAYKAGKASDRDIRWMNRYGLSPEEHADKFIEQYKQSNGFKTDLGGYQSNFWLWQDAATANKFADAVYRATKDTVISANALDAPFWTDSNGSLGVMGPIIKGFSGWAFASLNRYVIPFMQKPDAQQMIGVLGMIAAGALVSPSRRMAKGENPYPDSMTDEQWAYEVFSDSSCFSYFSMILNEANTLTGKSLLGDLTNDKYKDRARTGFLGPAWTDFNRFADFFTALGSNEMNQADALQMARMVPYVNSSWTWGLSSHLIKSLGLPANRQQAHLQKGS